ncbi:MAG: hypothetical protein KJO07_22255, partial [Deltaproteobacteria bacterium]|nr:hypothetical protein [Deltaproteobacteria bacterium]
PKAAAIAEAVSSGTETVWIHIRVAGVASDSAQVQFDASLTGLPIDRFRRRLSGGMGYTEGMLNSISSSQRWEAIGCEQ